MISAEKYRPVLNDKSYKKLIKGTASYFEYWSEQVRRCKEGYKPSGGSYITGPHYFYMNFCKIDLYDESTNRKGMYPPKYRDQDHEYFSEIQEAKNGGYGIICLKARRKGFSFMNANLLLHEWTFYPNSSSGVGSQQEHYVNDFRKKLLMSYFAINPVFRNKYLRNSKTEFTGGYKQKDDGTYIEKGSLSSIHFRVIENPDAFRGTSLGYMVVEESGEVKKLKKLYNASEECFREGDIQFGTPIIGGTSNKITNDSDDFMEMIYNPQEFNLKALFIPASKVYHGFFNYDTGQSDVEGANEAIEKRAAEKKKSKDKEAYYTFRQEMPLKIEHAFLQHGTTPWDLEKINKQKINLLTNKRLNIVANYNLNWQKDGKGKELLFSKVEFALDSDKESKFRIVERPEEGFVDAYVAAVDPYHIDDEFEDGNFNPDSKGCMYVYKKYINTDKTGDLVVAEYFDRPETKSEFYENCAKLAIAYNCKILVEHNDDGFLRYFVDNNLTRYLKERPRSADSPYSSVTNKYGIHMKTYQKSLLVELIDEYIKNSYEDIYYTQLLDEMAVYGTKNTDRVMAFGMALMHAQDDKQRVRSIDEIEKAKGEPFLMGLRRDGKGNVYLDRGNDWDGKRKSPKFDF